MSSSVADRYPKAEFFLKDVVLKRGLHHKLLDSQ